jgi:hypothetical protein
MTLLRGMMLCMLFLCANLFFGVSESSSLNSPQGKDIPELRKIFLDDQRDRGNDPFPEFDAQGKALPRKTWPVLAEEVIARHDDERRARVHELLHAEKIQTGQDFWFAAMVFQHGQNPEDYLLAHVLASTAVAKGNRNALWLAAASLDRYLLSVGKKQIYGTQFDLEKGATWTQKNYDKDLLDDNLRAASCVTSYDQQQKQIRAAQHSGEPLDANTGVMACVRPQ